MNCNTHTFVILIITTYNSVRRPIFKKKVTKFSVYCKISRFYLFECSKPAGYLTHPPLRDIDTSARHKLEETIRLEKAIFSYK